MRILVYGAGAVGGFLGGILTAAGADVTLVARGAQHDALSQRGLLLEGPKSGRPDRIRVRVCRPGEEKPPYDLIVVGLKSHQIPGAAAHMVGLLARDGMIMLGQNGLPYWYFEKLDSPLRGSRLASVDPDGTLAKTIPIDAVIGGVMNKPADLVEPGHIRLADQATDRLVIGELDNKMTPRLAAIKAVIEPAGWTVVVSDNIRAVKW
ncbi:MAG TPA: 2-dehydropantoate 2-reductase N-terminal domain-containing protein, partial [Burkholderiales bacterium]|nr:2-dehydropantoate 2-reductase N-terminal domain-containing protein [Burkholderiales bacterium]